VTVSGDAVSFSNGLVKALTPGRAILRFEYRGVSIEKDIRVYYGKLEIESDPSGADVYINGTYEGTTPLSVYLEDSDVRVTLKKYGYETLEKWVQLDKGKEKPVSFKLTEKLQCIEADIPSKLTVGKEVWLRVKAVRYYTEKYLSTYEYDVHVEGDAVEYSSDGRLIAKNPGTAKVRIAYKGQTLEKEIKVILGTLKVTSTPSHAKVYVNYSYEGRTPLTIEVTQKGFTLSVEKNGYETYSRHITFRPGDKEELHVTLPEKIKDMEVNVPEHMIVGDEIELNVEAVGYYTRKTLSTWEYSVDISDEDVLEYRHGKLVAKNPGSAVVTVRYGNKKSVRRTVRVYYTSVYISSDPSGADIYMDGRYFGTTPKKVYIQQAAYSLSIKLSKSGYEDVKKTIRLSKGTAESAYMKLIPKPVSLHLYVPREVEVGEKVGINIKVDYGDGSSRYLSKYEVSMRVDGALKTRAKEIVAEEPGKGTVTVSYKGLSDSKTVNVYKVVKITSDPPGAEVYTEGGERLGKTPVNLKLFSDYQKIVLKSPGYQTSSVYVHYLKSEVNIRLKLPMGNVLEPLLLQGKIKKLADAIKKKYSMKEGEEEKIVEAVRYFEEEKVKEMKCSTQGCRLLKNYALRYMNDVKRAIEAKDVKTAARLLRGVRPGVAEALESKDKPWSKALNAASDRLVIIPGLVENAKAEGSKIEMVKKWKSMGPFSKKTYPCQPDYLWLLEGIEMGVGLSYLSSVPSTISSNTIMKSGKVAFARFISPLTLEINESGISKGIFIETGIKAFGIRGVVYDPNGNALVCGAGFPSIGIGYYILKAPKHEYDTWRLIDSQIGIDFYLIVPIGIHASAEAMFGCPLFSGKIGVEIGYGLIGYGLGDYQFTLVYMNFFVSVSITVPTIIFPVNDKRFPYTQVK